VNQDLGTTVTLAVPERNATSGKPRGYLQPPGTVSPKGARFLFPGTVTSTTAQLKLLRRPLRPQRSSLCNLHEGFPTQSAPTRALPFYSGVKLEKWKHEQISGLGGLMSAGCRTDRLACQREPHVFPETPPPDEQTGVAHGAVWYSHSGR